MRKNQQKVLTLLKKVYQILLVKCLEMKNKHLLNKIKNKRKENLHGVDF